MQRPIAPSFCFQLLHDMLVLSSVKPSWWQLHTFRLALHVSALVHSLDQSCVNMQLWVKDHG